MCNNQFNIYLNAPDHPILNEKTTPEPKIGFMWRWQLQMFFLIYMNYQNRLRCANCEMVLLIFMSDQNIDMNRYECIKCILFEHFRIWSSALWWLNEICNQPKPLCIRAQFSKLLHFLHIPEERSSKQCTAAGDFAGASIFQKWSLFSL